MRSKIGTQSRLAAHILALILLIIMLVYVAPPAAIIAARSAGSNLAGDAAIALVPPADGLPESAETENPSFPVPASTAEPVDLAILSRERVNGDFGTISEPAPIPLQPSTLPLRPPESAAPEDGTTIASAPDAVAEPASRTASPVDAAEEPVGESRAADAPEARDAADETPGTDSGTEAAVAVPEEPVATVLPDADGAEEPPAAPAPEPSVGEGDGVPATAGPAPSGETVGTPEPVESGTPEAPGEPPADDTVARSPVSQPDESGALVVVPSVNGNVIQSEPLANANLEVLGDGVYWLGPRHDLEKELAAIPELATLVLLAPLPGYRVEGFEHVKTEIIPADAMDLDGEAVEHFLYLASSGPAPVVAAAIPGARGAGLFKGAYLLAVRGMPIEDVLQEIAPELEEAGTAGDEIEHRLRRLGD